MKKGIIIIVSLLITQAIHSQTISKKDFINTEWFSHNTDSAFFFSDTISLIKYSNIFEPASGRGYKSYYESESLSDSKSVKFQFKRQGKLNFWVRNYHSSSIATLGERTWKVDKHNAELIIYRNGIIEWTLKLDEKKKIEFEDKNQSFITTELKMIKKK